MPELTCLPELLLPWFAENRRDLPWRRDREPYHVWLSEIMLQQTRVEAVRGYYARFLQRLPTVEALAGADEDVLLKLWEGLGYYSRVRNLQRAAQELTRRGGFPQTAEELERLPGIGAYTAGAIASICFEQKAPAVDGNVLRVLTRFLASDACIDQPRVRRDFAGRDGLRAERGAAVRALSASGRLCGASEQQGAAISGARGKARQARGAAHGAPDAVRRPARRL